MGASGHHRCCCGGCELLLEWLLNEGAGAVAHDTSGYGKDGAISGAYTWQADGILFSYPGLSNVANLGVSHINGLSKWSYSLAAKQTVSGAFKGILTSAGNRSINFQHDIVAGSGPGSFTVDTDVWASYVLGSDGTNTYLWRNTTLLGTSAASSLASANVIAGTEAAFRVGFVARMRVWGCLIGSAARQALADEAALL